MSYNPFAARFSPRGRSSQTRNYHAALDTQGYSRHFQDLTTSQVQRLSLDNEQDQETPLDDFGKCLT